MNIHLLSAMTAIVILTGCATHSGEASDAASEAASVQNEVNSVEAISLLGEPLYQIEASPDQAEAAAQAMARLQSGALLGEDDYLDIGFALAGAGRYRDAIAAYSKGISEYPQSYKLRRHRAHRYITTRQIENAYTDLKEAEALVREQDAASVYEMKGDEPHGTYAHWIDYHLGIYYYLKQDFEKSAAEFSKCVETSTDNDMLIGSVDWLYNAELRAGNADKAEAVLDLVAEDIEADETYPYYKRVMIYKGVFDPEEIVDLDSPKGWNGRDATVAYGLASQMIAAGQKEAAKEVLKGILDTPYWPVWAYVSAEADYAMLMSASGSN